MNSNYDVFRAISARMDVTPRDFVLYDDAFKCVLSLHDEEKVPMIELNHDLMRRLGLAMKVANSFNDFVFLEKAYDLHKRCLFYTAPYCLDDFARAIEVERKPGKKFYEPRRHYLRPMIQGYQDLLDGKIRLLTVSQPKRTGKALTLDTKLVTPTGEIAMRDVKVGTVLIGADGRPTRVTDIFPQGKVPVYEVRFTDGARIKTCENHLWEVKYHNVNASSGSNAYSTKIVSTGDMLKSGVKGAKDQHSLYAVRFTQPVEYEHKDVLIDPYVFGVLIGDGCLSQLTPSLTCFDPEIVSEVEKRLPDDTIIGRARKEGLYLLSQKDRSHNNHTRSSLVHGLCDLGVMGKRAWEKQIPTCYLYNDSRVRMELLQGLLDTDGCCNSNHIEFSTTSPSLRDDVIFLVRSLGGKASYKERMGRYRKDGKIVNTRINYRVHIQFPSGVVPFKLPRKANVYAPKREQLYHYIDEIVPCGEAEAQCICVDNADHLFLVADRFVATHNSQTEILFTLMISGKFPDRSTLMEGTGDDLVKSFYSGCLEYLDTESEYSYYKIFPDAKVVQTNADLKTINLNSRNRFPSIMCRSIDSRQVGLSEATNALVLDDCVEGREEAKNRQRLEDKWEIISGDIMGRMIEGTPLVFTGTRYSIYDPIGKIQEHAEKEGWAWRAIEIPALDPVTDESNYEHIREGKRVFTTAYFREQRDLLSEEQFESEFQQQPFEAKGVLFPAKDLNYFFELPTDREPDTIFAACDTAESGSDSVSMPVACIYGQDVYIVDVVFDNSPPEVTKPACAKCLYKNKAASATFESNNAGTYYARDVMQLCQSLGLSINIRTKRSISNKRTRIEMSSDNIKKHFFFRDPSTYDRGSQYFWFMKELTSYTRIGKVPHDDAPDSLSMLENELRTLIMPQIEIFSRPF